jgi:hypothetical protein
MSVTLQKIRKYSANELIETFGKIISLTPEEVEKVFDDPSSTILEQALINALRSKNAPLMNLVLDRVMGKVPEEVTLKTEIKPVKVNLEGKTESELKVMLMERLSALKAVK